MTRQRLRPAYDRDELARIYPAPHQHDRWPDHVERVAATIALGEHLIDCAGAPVLAIADLSAGDGAILNGCAAYATERSGRGCALILGDFAPGYPITGMIEDTIAGIDPVDLFICCETLEHLNDPDAVLAAIRGKTRLLLASTPVNEQGQGPNPEHYWSWDTGDLADMLERAGFDPFVSEVMDCAEGTAYQLWGCR